MIATILFIVIRMLFTYDSFINKIIMDVLFTVELIIEPNFNMKEIIVLQ